ncbi:Zn-dependent oxidoreductase [Nocardiopsis terrae]|uniref:NADPH:quinone reductase-like Zn-dependent oxidoreductase n=1 Tax=Nocardiopsis terrae TaxID=372655 RepID=A0ABR9HBF1_9ACTN|nr:zinc-binding dehydrogenase [Nocardiopsis terrae]MBE1456350.1 NADPH:quinone reductase-like Zn-dependent oxidoreductase [Nocardiopsis terrae]GHC77355.1 Zn-dependent oxidoreductase [Nocardiopsis terrae]
MFAITAARISFDDPLSGLEAGERPDPEPREGWTTVRVRAASLNHHDLWSLRGVALGEDRLPMVLGGDAAGIDEDGNEVIVHSVITEPAAPGRSPRFSLLSEVHDGTLAEKVLVPRENLLPKPPELSFEEAACLPTAWLTAYSMLFGKADLRPGSTVLVQGAGGGVSAALITLASRVGHRVYVTSRSEAKRAGALELGAYAALPSGERLPERVDVVFDSVGQATWKHSIRSLKPGGAVVTCGATSGDAPPAELTRVFFLQLRVLGSTMGTREELAALTEMCVRTGIRPRIDRVLPLKDAREGFRAMADGELFGKVVLTP